MISCFAISETKSSHVVFASVNPSTFQHKTVNSLSTRFYLSSGLLVVYSIPDPPAAFEEPVANNSAEFDTTGPLYKFFINEELVYHYVCLSAAFSCLLHDGN